MPTIVLGKMPLKNGKDKAWETEGTEGFYTVSSEENKETWIVVIQINWEPEYLG